MPEEARYRITDPRTGAALIVRGDHEPTQDEAAAIFAAQPPRSPGQAAKAIQPPEHEQKAYDVYGMKSAPMSVRARADTVPAQAKGAAIRGATQNAPVLGMYGEDNPIYSDPESGEPTIYNPPGIDFGDIPSMLPTFAEAVGSTGGAIGGAAIGGLPGAIAGAGAGATGAREAVERGSMALQGIDDPRSALEQAINAGTTFAGNAGGEAAGALTGFGIRSAFKNRARMGATPKEIQERIDAAALFGTNPSWAVATGSPGAEGFEGWLANYPGGHGVFRAKAAEQAVNIARGVSEKVKNIAGKPGADPVQAGKVVREGIEGFQQRFKDNAQAMYQRVDQEIPSTQKMPATRTLELLKEYAATPAGLEGSAEALQAKGLANFAAQFQKDMVVSGGAVPMDSLRFVRSALGRKMGEWSLNDDLPKAELKKIYRTLTQDIRQGIQEYGSDKALKMFDDANKYYLDNLEKMDDLLEPLIKNKVPERAFAAVETLSKNSPTTIKALRQSVTPEQWQVVAGSLIERLGKTKPGQGGLENFSIANFLRNYESIQAAGGDDMLNAMFGGAGMGNIKENLGKLAQFSQDTKRSSQAFFNPSGTAKNVSGATMAMGAVASAMTGDPRFAFGLFAVMGNANRAAKLLTSPKFVAWLAQGTKIAPTGVGSHMGRLTGIALSSDPDTRDAIQDFAADLSQIGQQPQGTP